jgi:uncharacterized protein (TIGR02996 family)
MTDETNFLCGMAAAPEDDALRLVYADWLEEQRAELIRAQVELARLGEADPRYPELLARSRRCGVLTAPGRRPMLDHVPGARITFRRGLIAGAWMEVKDYLATAPGAWQGPVEHLRLQPLEGAGAALARRPELARVGGLHLPAWRATDLRPLLAGNELLAGLRSLRLEQPYTDRATDLGRLGEELDLPGLEALAISSDFRAWRRWIQGCARPLKRLWLNAHGEFDGVPEGAPGYDWLWKTRHGRHLTHAAIWFPIWHSNYGSSEETPYFTDLDDVLGRGQAQYLLLPRGGEQALLRCGNWGGLRDLQFTRGLGSWSIDQLPLSHAPQARQLRVLRLGHWDFSERGVNRPKWGPELAGLRELRVECMAADEFLALLSGPYTANLLRLDVAHYLTEKNFLQLLATPLPQLRRLRFPAIDEAGIEGLCRTKNLPNLCTLDAHLSPESAQRLARARHPPHLSLAGGWVLGEGRAEPLRADILPLADAWWDET